MDRTAGALASRLRAQLLSGPPASDVESVVRRLLAVQAQDARAFRLAVRARSTGCTAADVDAALSEHRTLVVSWLCRGTLHLVGAEDYWWLHRLTAPRRRVANARRLTDHGIDEVGTARGVAAVMEAVADGPRSRAELTDVLAATGLPVAGQAGIHLLFAASLRAPLVRGPMRGAEHCFVDASRWLTPPPEPIEDDEALARLALRYLAGHGPAAIADLAYWAGIPRRDAARAVALLGGQVRDEGGGLVRLASGRAARQPPGPRLLGMFDPVLHGWADREFVLAGAQGVVTLNGMFRATALVDGRVAGVWSIPDGRVTLRPLRELSPEVLSLLDVEAADVLRFLGLPPAPLRAEPQAAGTTVLT